MSVLGRGNTVQVGQRACEKGLCASCFSAQRRHNPGMASPRHAKDISRSLSALRNLPVTRQRAVILCRTQPLQIFSTLC
jgi:hypothetical protein